MTRVKFLMIAVMLTLFVTAAVGAQTTDEGAVKSSEIETVAPAASEAGEAEPSAAPTDEQPGEAAPAEDGAKTEDTGEAEPSPTEKNAASIAHHGASIDTMWTLLAAFLVFFMQAGFAMVEIGFTRAKNALNIIMKNLMDFSIGSIGYWAIGFGIMFGGDLERRLRDLGVLPLGRRPGKPRFLRDTHIMDLPGGLRRHRRHHRLGRHGRAHQVRWLPGL